jgi:hypothetical protein
MYDQGTYSEKIQLNTMVAIPLIYKGHALNKEYIIDIPVEQGPVDKKWV